MTNCRAKLRHAEYYDFQDIQDKLYADSKAGKEFKHLEELITLPQNIKLAYRNLKKNRGSRTAGTDPEVRTGCHPYPAHLAGWDFSGRKQVFQNLFLYRY